MDFGCPVLRKRTLRAVGVLASIMVASVYRPLFEACGHHDEEQGAVGQTESVDSPIGDISPPKTTVAAKALR